MAWLLDTNVLSELRRPKPEPRVVSFVSDSPLDQLYTSVVTLAEIRFGIELVSEPMLKWRLLVEEGRKTGHTFSQPDLIIAATAMHHGLTVVTRDRSDYDKAHVPVLNPWDG
jgi:toxin FitB